MYTPPRRNAAEIARHPRNLTSTVRRQDTTRKEGRERRKARKEEELLQKREEVKRLKALKMKELRRKLEQIGKEGGLQDIDKHQGTTKSRTTLSTELLTVLIIALQDLDLEGDWDSDTHDRQMAGIYAQGNDRESYDAEKPTWDDDINIDDIAPPVASSSKKEKKSKKDRKKGKKAGDEDYEMGEGDEAYREDEEWEDEAWDGTEKMRKKKLQEYMDSLLELEFNDVVSATRFRHDNRVSYHALTKVAGIPTRFKYTPTVPQTFGLTPAEILMADDKDLNQYMGVKKYAPYRKGGNWDKQRPERLKQFRDKFNVKKAGGSAEAGEVPAKKRKGKKERQRTKAAMEGGTVPKPDEPQAGSEEKKRKLEEPSEGLEASSPKKRKRRHKKSSKTASAE